MLLLLISAQGEKLNQRPVLKYLPGVSFVLNFLQYTCFPS